MSQLRQLPTAVSSHEEAVVGVHLGHDREREAEHAGVALAEAMQERGVPVAWVATHRTVTDNGPAVSLSFCAAVDPALLDGYLAIALRETGVTVLDRDSMTRAVSARDAMLQRTEGRVVWFPGHESVGDTITVGELIARTGIDAVSALGGTAAGFDDHIVTRRYVRPRLTGGQLVLHVQPASGGTFVPFETPSPTPCCVDHA